MTLLTQLGILLVSYLLGAVPAGYVLVKLRTGQDIRTIQSGRTGGTNAARAAGWWVGLATGVSDVLKAMLAVYLARWLAPGDEWLAVLAPIAAILGHNYSLLMARRDERGRLLIGGGAGGAPVLGGAAGLWFPAVFIILPLGFLIYYFVGYASLATMSAGILSIIIFGIRAYLGLGPWEYLAYGAISTAIVIWALRPNIRRLREGTERLHGYRARNRVKTGESKI